MERKYSSEESMLQIIDGEENSNNNSVTIACDSKVVCSLPIYWRTC